MANSSYQQCPLNGAPTRVIFGGGALNIQITRQIECTSFHTNPLPIHTSTIQCRPKPSRPHSSPFTTPPPARRNSPAAPDKYTGNMTERARSVFFRGLSPTTTAGGHLLQPGFLVRGSSRCHPFFSPTSRGHLSRFPSPSCSERFPNCPITCVLCLPRALPTALGGRVRTPPFPPWSGLETNKAPTCACFLWGGVPAWVQPS